MVHHSVLFNNAKLTVQSRICDDGYEIGVRRDVVVEVLSQYKNKYSDRKHKFSQVY